MRGIKPETWTDSRFVSLSPLARLMFVASWNFACDNGHVEDDPFQLRLRTLPADAVDGEELVAEIAARGLYRRDGDGWLVIENFDKHQKIDRRFVVTCGRDGCSKGARGDLDETPTSPRRGPRVVSEGSRDEGEGEGEGEGGRPRKRGTRLPDDFPITDDMRQWGREKAPDVNAAREHEKFCDYWHGVSGQRGVKRDWLATWRNWMRRAQEDAERRLGPRNQPGVDFQTDAEAINDLNRRQWAWQEGA